MQTLAEALSPRVLATRLFIQLMEIRESLILQP